MRTKKVTSIVLSLALIISSVTGIGFAKDASAAQDTSKILVYVAAQGESTDGTKVVNLPKKAIHVQEGATAEEVIKTALDASEYKDNYIISQTSWGASLDGIGGVNGTADYTWYWNFCVNNTMASVGISGYQVKDQDKISLLYQQYPPAALQCDSFVDDATKNPTDDEAAALLASGKKQQSVLAKKIYTEQFEKNSYVPGIEDASSLYTVFSLVQSGLEEKDFYDQVSAKVTAQLSVLANKGKVYDPQNDQYITLEDITKISKGAASQYYGKIALCMAALGKDITNIGGMDLAAKLTDRTIYKESSIYSRESMILFAIDAANAKIPEGEQYLTRAELVNSLLNDVDNQIDTSILWGSLDSAAMAIQALAPYTETTIDGVDQTAVKAAVKKVLSMLSTMQGTDGIYGDSYSPNNVWTLAQVMTTIGLFQVNPLTEKEYDFIKNGKTVFDISAGFVDGEAGTVSADLMGFQPEQLLRGLTSCIAAAEGKDSVYSAKKPIYTAKDSKQTALTLTMIGKIADQTYTGKKITPSVVVKANGKTLKAGVDYTVSYKDNQKVGTGYAIVTGKGNYILSQKVSFKIVKKAVQVTKSLKKPVIVKTKSSKKKTLTVQFKKVTNAKKYVVEISKNKKFKKATKKTVKTTKATFKKLSSKKKYYVRVIAYNGKVKSSYSKVVKSCKVK